MICRAVAQQLVPSSLCCVHVREVQVGCILHIDHKLTISFDQVMAPGVSVLNLGLDGTYVTMTGTSFAAAHVAGAAALILQK